MNEISIGIMRLDVQTGSASDLFYRYANPDSDPIQTPGSATICLESLKMLSARFVQILASVYHMVTI